MPDPMNEKCEVNKDWLNKSIDDRSAIVSFIKNSNYQFSKEASHILNDLAQRLKPNVYRKGDVLKPWGQDSSHLYFICSGAVAIKERKFDHACNSLKAKIDDDDSHLSITIITANVYKEGQNFGDPELNYNTPPNCQVFVQDNDTRIVSLSVEVF